MLAIPCTNISAFQNDAKFWIAHKKNFSFIFASSYLIYRLFGLSDEDVAARDRQAALNLVIVKWNLKNS